MQFKAGGLGDTRLGSARLLGAEAIGVYAEGILCKEARPFVILGVAPIAVTEGVVFKVGIAEVQKVIGKILIEGAVKEAFAGVTLHRREEGEIPLGVARAVEGPLAPAAVHLPEVREDAAVDRGGGTQVGAYGLLVLNPLQHNGHLPKISGDAPCMRVAGVMRKIVVQDALVGVARQKREGGAYGLALRIGPHVVKQVVGGRKASCHGKRRLVTAAPAVGEAVIVMIPRCDR